MESDLIDVEVAEGVWKTIHWSFCPIKGCPNRTWHNSKYCYPHTNYTGLGLLATIIEATIKPILTKVGDSNDTDIVK